MAVTPCNAYIKVSKHDDRQFSGKPGRGYRRLDLRIAGSAGVLFSANIADANLVGAFMGEENLLRQDNWLPARWLATVSVLLFAAALFLVSGTPAKSDFADGERAFQRGDYTRAVKLWRRAAWQEDDLFSQLELGDLYSKGKLVNRDYVEAYVWYYLASVNTTALGLTPNAYQIRKIKLAEALEKRKRVYVPMVPQERAEARDRIVYILASRGAEGFFKLGEIFDERRACQRGQRYNDSKELVTASPDEELDIKEGKALIIYSRSIVKGGESSPYTSGASQWDDKHIFYVPDPNNPNDIRPCEARHHESLFMTEDGISPNNAEALSYYILAAGKGHPFAAELRTDLTDHMNGSRGGAPGGSITISTRIIESAKRRAANWRPPFETYPGKHSDESEGDSDREDALARINELDLRWLQKAMKALGIYKGEPDNEWGGHTAESMRAYQKMIGAPVTKQMTEFHNLTGEQKIRLIKTVAARGDKEIQNVLGSMYYYGIGEPVNYSSAQIWFERSADQLYPYALYNLGVMYRDGFGTPVDKNQAATYFMAAKQAGYPGKEIDQELKELGWCNGEDCRLEGGRN